jgi:GntR family transcriptional repressor for pyruvate dehydrogenase complex
MEKPFPIDNKGEKNLFKKLPQRRMYEEIVNQILEALMRGDLRPNEKLPSEKELIDIFGVSRTTVREAIRSLEHMGMVEIRQGSLGGAYIKEIDVNTVVDQTDKMLRLTNITFLDLAQARSTLEGMIIRELIPEKLTDLHLEKLEENQKKAWDAYKNKQKDQRLADNFSFHSFLAEICGNPIIMMMHKIIVNLSFHFFKNVEPSDQMIEKTFQYHYQIIEKLKEKNFTEASRISSEHINEVSSLIIEKSKHQSRLKKKEE